MNTATTPTATLQNILGMDRRGLEHFLTDHGQPVSRATEILRCIHSAGLDNFEQMPSLNKNLRAMLTASCIVQAPNILSESVATDGTRKWLMSVPGGSSIETVFIPERDRGTLCISSQVGCSLNCSFCSTARQGFQRNLSSAEIIGQLWRASKRLRELSDSPWYTQITNIVMMGMGEPLLNFEAVASSLSIMRDPFAYALPRRRVAVSTSGVVPAIARLAAECDVSLAVSLHAPDDNLRNVLVPINKKYPISKLLDACKEYVANNKKHFITIEYVMLQNVNDTPAHAYALAEILQLLPCKINLIPFNPFPNIHYVSSTPAVISEFAAILAQHGYVCTVRKTRGEAIDAACGQLVGKVMDRTRRSSTYKSLNVTLLN